MTTLQKIKIKPFRYVLHNREINHYFHANLQKTFESPSGWDIFCLKNFDTFTRTTVRVSKMNAVARAQLTFQMLTSLKKYVLHNKEVNHYFHAYLQKTQKCYHYFGQQCRKWGLNPIKCVIKL